MAGGIITAVKMLSFKLQSGKCNCDRCRTKRLWVLEEKLGDAQNKELK
jgi:hypothetical protein